MQIHKDVKHGILRRAYGNVMKREEMFKAFIKRLCESGIASEVFLIGSRVRGDHTSSSDFDVVVVIEDGDILEVAEKVSALKKEPLPVDVVVLTKDDLQDPIYREMLKDRVKIY